MKNLIKNVVRSFKKNKISIIGLVLLLFFGLGAFCVMSNTTANITNQYTSISKQGKLHDFTASELYNVGSAGFQPETKGIKYTVKSGEETKFETFDADKFVTEVAMPTTSMYSASGLGTDDGTYYVMLPEQVKHEGSEATTFIRTYRIFLAEQHSTGLYKNFAKTKKGTRYTEFDFRVTETYTSTEEIPEDVTKYQELMADWGTSSVDPEALAKLNIYSRDYQNFLKFVNDKTQSIFTIMTTTDTPLSQYLDSKYSNEVEHRTFKSINVTATKDNVFYKIIDSNIEDTINTMVLFKDPNNRYGNNLFSVNDWSPYSSDIIFYDTDGNVLKGGTVLEDKITVPSDFNEVAITTLHPLSDLSDWSANAKFVYSQLLQIRFKRMLAANRSTDKLDDTLKVLAARDLTAQQYYEQLFTEGSQLASNYYSYFSTWYTNYGESVTLSANGNVVYQWTETLGTPQTCTISNWTSRFAVVNPQHLDATTRRVIDPSVLTNFAPFAAWYDAHKQSNAINGDSISQDIAKQWFNSLTSDQFTFWVKPDSLKVDEMVYDNIDDKGTTITVKKGTGKDQWSGVPSQYTIPCGGYDQVIWGCGLTPDFMYPVVDISRPTPNVKTEALVYSNEAAYNSFKLAFANSTVEDYLLARFKPNVNTNRRKEIVSDINAWAKTNMIYPQNIDCAYFANDTNNVLNSAGFRVAYIPNLVRVIKIVSVILCSFIGILCLVICFVIIKRYVENNRVNIGIMRANGISKGKIALSLFPFALLPALIGGIGAYVVGLLLQAPTLSLFKNYWTLPTPLISFDWVSFVLCILAPFILFTLICFISTFVVLRARTVDLMKPGSEFKTNAFSRVVKKPFKYFGVLTRFRVSLAFNSISRLLMLAAMSCLTMSSLVFAMTTFDKLNQSKQINSSQFDYNFSLKLTTPTVSGGAYATYDYGRLGRFDASQYLYNVSWDTSDEAGKDYSWYNPAMYSQLAKPYSVNTIAGLEALGLNYRNTIGANGNMLFPNMSDSSGQNQDLMYLQDKTCARLCLDYNIGLAPLASSNPWEIALALMPANSRNLAADSFNDIVQTVGASVAKATSVFNTEYDKLIAEGITAEEAARQAAVTANRDGDWYRSGHSYLRGYYNIYGDFFTSKTEGETTTYTLKTDMGTVGYLFSAFNEDFLAFLKNIYNEHPELVRKEYTISYGVVPLNWDLTTQKRDETYTYISANILSTSSNKGIDPSEEITIEGIPEKSEFIKLTDKKGNDLNSILFAADNSDEEVKPIVINAYAAHKYKLGVGDTIRIKATNMADRFIRTLHPENYKDDSDKLTFKIVGVSVGTNDSAFYTTQFDANTFLGLPNGLSWNKTHKYMMWTDTDETWGEKKAGASLVDLAGIGADATHITKYSFTDPKQPVIDTTSITRKNTVVPVGFNGVYTSNTTGKPITSGLSLYSYTGMYPGTSVHRSVTNDKFVQILMYGPNLAIANLMTGINSQEVYEANYKWINGGITSDQYQSIVESFRNKVADVYGDTTMITSMIGAMDVAASDLIYSNLISTFDLAQTSIMAIIIPITIIIVAIISNLIITDSKKMAAMLKALGYSDRKNLMSILALFVPTIFLGLILAVPLTFGIVTGYQAIIFNTANILVDVSQKWWYYVVGVGGIGIILLATYGIGYVSIKRDRLVDQIK